MPYANPQDKLLWQRRENARKRAAVWGILEKKKQQRDEEIYAKNVARQREREEREANRKTPEQRKRDAAERKKLYFQLNPEKKRRKDARYRDRNREALRVRDAERKRNGAGALAKLKKRKAVPRWLTVNQKEKMAVVYEAARELSERAVWAAYAVDHVVPLRGRRVCGLHVPWNLQILTAEENSEKSNHLPPADQLVDYSAKGYARVRAKLKRRAQ